MDKIFDIDRLDHVAITVKDIEASITWYQKVLGLKAYKLPKWGEYPVFLLSGKAGIALFPAELEHHELPTNATTVKIDHFAFHVSQQNLKKAIAHYESLNLEYQFKDHHYYHSVYTDDLDGHTVELTSQIEEYSFFN